MWLFISHSRCKEELKTDGKATPTVRSLCTSLATLYKLFPVIFTTAFGSEKYSNYLRGKQGVLVLEKCPHSHHLFKYLFISCTGSSVCGAWELLSAAGGLIAIECRLPLVQSMISLVMVYAGLVVPRHVGS